MRPPNLADVDQYRLYINRLIEEDASVGVGIEDPYGQDRARSTLEEKIRANTEGIGLNLFVFDKDRLVASVSCDRWQGRQQHVADRALTVDRDYRNQHIGPNLAKVSEERLKQMGVEQVVISVYDSNKHNLHVAVEKNGFKEFGVQPGGVEYKGKREDLHWLYKDL